MIHFIAYLIAQKLQLINQFCFIIFSSMQFNPLESEQTNTANQTKTKFLNAAPIPLCIKQMELLTNKKQGISSLGKIHVIGRVVNLKDMVGRTVVTLSDQTGIINVIESQNSDLLEDDQYFEFVVNARIDKQQVVFISVHCSKIVDFNKLQFHFANVMMHQCQIPTQ